MLQTRSAGLFLLDLVVDNSTEGMLLCVTMGNLKPFSDFNQKEKKGIL